MNLVWSRRASRDLEQVGAYVALDAPERARSFVQTLIERGKQAQRLPGAGRIVPEFQDENIRELIEGSYRIVYEIRPAKKEIVVLTVFEGHRLLQKFSSRRK